MVEVLITSRYYWTIHRTCPSIDKMRAEDWTRVRAREMTSSMIIRWLVTFLSGTKSVESKPDSHRAILLTM